MKNKSETAEMNNEIPQDTLRNSAAKVNVNDLLRRVRVEQKKEKKGNIAIIGAIAVACIVTKYFQETNLEIIYLKFNFHFFVVVMHNRFSAFKNSRTKSAQLITDINVGFVIYGMLKKIRII